MTDLFTSPALVNLFLGLWQLALLLVGILSIVYVVFQKRHDWLAVTIPISIISYLLLQCTTSVTNENTEGFALSEFVSFIGHLSLMIHLIICLVLTILEAVIIYHMITIGRSHLSEMSYKYAVDAFPMGICCFDENGRVRLKNQVMDEICLGLTGSTLINGLSFKESISSMASINGYTFQMIDEHILIHTEDKRVYKIHEDTLDDDGANLRLLTAEDITSEYEKTRILTAKQEEVTELNRRLTEYNSDILKTITAKEILDAKIGIHDELGADLLHAKNYLVNGGSEKERNEVIRMLKDNADFLKRQRKVKDIDEFALILETAKTLNINVNIDGVFPKDEKLSPILITAIHECLTNTLRHAHGDELNVKFVDEGGIFSACFKNNGEAPGKEIVEKGGLLILRNLVEDNNGNMKITTDGEFCLTITFHKE